MLERAPRWQSWPRVARGVDLRLESAGLEGMHSHRKAGHVWRLSARRSLLCVEFIRAGVACRRRRYGSYVVSWARGVR